MKKDRRAGHETSGGKIGTTTSVSALPEDGASAAGTEVLSRASPGTEIGIPGDSSTQAGFRKRVRDGATVETGGRMRTGGSTYARHVV